MKSVISGLLVALSMYSAIPVPQVNWEKQTMRWALGFLPLIGVLIGAIEWFWFAFCVHFGAGRRVLRCDRSADSSAVSGGIHLDGLCDTCDALCSFGDREKRLAILKDPHVGRVWAALADGIPAGRGRVFCPDLRPACASSAGMHRICFCTDNGRPQGGCVTVRERQRTCTYLCGKQR